MRFSRYRFIKPVVLLLLLVVVGFWLFQSSDRATANNWSWADQVQMEVAMAKAAQASPATVPALDRHIPETETALFALG